MGCEDFKEGQSIACTTNKPARTVSVPVLAVDRSGRNWTVVFVCPTQVSPIGTDPIVETSLEKIEMKPNPKGS